MTAGGDDSEARFTRAPFLGLDRGGETDGDDPIQSGERAAEDRLIRERGVNRIETV